MLLLRGPQTAGEIRARATRLHEFASAAAAESAVADLAGPPEPIVMLLEREPGQKEPRWEHQLGVEGTAEAGSHAPASAPASIPARPAAPQVEAESMMLRIKYLEQQMREVQAELSRLRGTTDLV